MSRETTYAVSPLPEFSAIQLEDGTIYHQRGQYRLDGDELLIPVNRSYRPVEPAGVSRQLQPEDFTYDRLINDTVPEDAELYLRERRLRIFGKTLLAVALDDSAEEPKAFSSSFAENKCLSSGARQVLCELSELLDAKNHGITLGLHGSHAVGLNGVDSDMDLVAWTPRDERAETLRSINEALLSLGYVPANDTKKFDEYSVRIANLTGLSDKIGAFLASQRNRWISPNSTGTSLQLIHADYNHDLARSLLEPAVNMDSEYVERVDNMPVSIAPGAEPFNYPRLWKIDYDGEEADVISFNMVHQGMGTDGRTADFNAEKFVLSGDKYKLQDGRTVFCLKENGDYILPASLIL